MKSQRLPEPGPALGGLKGKGSCLDRGRHYAGEPAQTFVCSPSFSASASPCKGGHSFCYHVCAKAHRI